MFKILDTPTLLQLMDAAPEAVLHTIETGGWSGCVWPGHPEWDAHETCIQIRSLALHYFTRRHPIAEAQRYEAIAQLLASQGCPQNGDTHLDTDPIVPQAILWLWALAGGLPPPDTPDHATHAPQKVPASVQLPGGDPVVFTATALDLLEALFFTGETAAQQVATTFLRLHTDDAAHRALEFVAILTQQETARAVDARVTCMDCGTAELDIWYTGQTWGETLCESCYEARVTQGQADPQGSGEARRDEGE
jgi:hypothetical protein